MSDWIYSDKATDDFLAVVWLASAPALEVQAIGLLYSRSGASPSLLVW